MISEARERSFSSILKPNGTRSALLVRIVLPSLLSAGAWLVATSLPSSIHRPIYSLFLTAVFLSSWAGGWISATVALALSLASISYFFIPPVRSFAVGLNDAINMTVFTCLSVLVITTDTARKKAVQRQAIITRERDEALGRLEELRKLIPCCVECRRPFEDAAHWSDLEAHLATLVRRRCLCPGCTDKLFQHASY